MSEGQSTTGESGRAHIDTIVDFVRHGLEAIAATLTPPEQACKHFRNARIEVLRGFRELIDHRIDHLSGRKAAGTRVDVE
jgi:hypothetical protein